MKLKATSYSKYLWLLLVAILASGCSTAFVSSSSDEAYLPKLQKNGDSIQLMVDGKPFLIRGGELHNSSASSEEYMNSVWAELKAMNINTVLAPVTWAQFEPKEGLYDYDTIDYLIENADKHDLKLIVLWFASWKNGQSSYAPLWVKSDIDRFPRVKTKDGESIETLSPFSTELLEADSSAYAKLNQRIREKDRNNVVVMMQPQNEVGVLGHRFDYSDNALKALNSNVPGDLLNYMVANKSELRSELYSVWEDNGLKESGTWLDVFGDNVYAREFLLARQYAYFIDKVAKSGREEIDLPTFVNAWIVQNDNELPGDYPNGGPVSRVMDIYKATAPNIDFMSPDIYLADFKGIIGDYHREDNPIFVPESTVDAGRAFYLVAEHDGLGFAPFGIDSSLGNKAFGEAYGVLKELEPIILDAQPKHNHMFGLLKQDDESGRIIDLEDIRIDVGYVDPNLPSYGLVVRLDQEEFLVAGVNMHVGFSSTKDDSTIYIYEVVEGRFDGEGFWEPGRTLNGDETFHHDRVRVYGRQSVTSSTSLVGGDLPPQPTVDNVSNFEVVSESVPTPGIYRVKLYER